MKKIVSLLVFFSLCSLVLKAQEEFRFGLQASPTFSWMTSSDNKINGNGTNLGLRLGMRGEFYFAENYAVISGIGFAFNQGGTLSHDQGGNFWPNSDLSDPKFNKLPDGIDVKYNIQYLEFPIGLKMQTREFGYVRYFAQIPVFTFGIETQARGTLKGGLNTEKENINEDVNPLNVSWGFGGGIEYTLSGSTSLVGGVFYQSGFTDVTRDKNAKKFVYDENMDVVSETDEDSNGVVRSITILVGIMF